MLIKELVILKIPKIKVKKKATSAEKKVKKKSGRTKNTILIILISLGIAIASAVLAFALYIIITSPDFVAQELYTKEEAKTLEDKELYQLQLSRITDEMLAQLTDHDKETHAIYINMKR